MYVPTYLLLDTTTLDTISSSLRGVDCPLSFFCVGAAAAVARTHCSDTQEYDGLSAPLLLLLLPLLLLNIPAHAATSPDLDHHFKLVKAVRSDLI